MDPTELTDDRQSTDDVVDSDGPDVADTTADVGAGPQAMPIHPRWPMAVLVTAVVVIVADQLTKWWALERLSGRRIIEVVGSLQFNLAFNSGTAFSLGSGLGPYIAVIAVVISLGLWWTSRSMLKTSSLLAVGLVVGGAIGNFLDRAFRPARIGEDGFLRGSVVDFIDLQWWPIFNIADAGIVVGGILIVLLGGFGPPPEPKPKSGTTAARNDETVDEKSVEGESVEAEPVSNGGASRNGDSENGDDKGGASKDGASKDGASKDGASKDGAASAPLDRALKDVSAGEAVVDSDD